MPDAVALDEPPCLLLHDPVANAYRTRSLMERGCGVCITFARQASIVFTLMPDAGAAASLGEMPFGGQLNDFGPPQ